MDGAVGFNGSPTLNLLGPLPGWVVWGVSRNSEGAENPKEDHGRVMKRLAVVMGTALA